MIKQEDTERNGMKQEETGRKGEEKGKKKEEPVRNRSMWE